MTNLTHLKTVSKSYNEACISTLERVLEEAKAGDFESVFMVAFRPDGDYVIIESTAQGILKKVGILHILAHTAIVESGNG